MRTNRVTKQTHNQPISHRLRARPTVQAPGRAGGWPLRHPRTMEANRSFGGSDSDTESSTANRQHAPQRDSYPDPIPDKRDLPGRLVTDGGVEVPRESPEDLQERGDGHPWQDAETLERLYIGEGLTTREIADRLGCTNGTVSRWLNIHDIQTRGNWVAGVEAAKRANREESVTQRTLPTGYEYWASKEWGGEERTNRIVYVHRLLAVSEFGFDAVTERDVHHRNGVPWDNRPENIALLSKSEHGRRHANQRWNGGESA